MNLYFENENTVPQLTMEVGEEVEIMLPDGKVFYVKIMKDGFPKYTTY